MALIICGLVLVVAAGLSTDGLTVLVGLLPIILGLWLVATLLGLLGRIASALEDIAHSLRDRSADRL